MSTLIDIPTVVGTLVTYFAMGGSDAAVEAIKGIAVNATLKLAELKDQLLCKPEVGQAVQQYQQNPLNMTLKAQLEDKLARSVGSGVPACRKRASTGGVPVKRAYKVALTPYTSVQGPCSPSAAYCSKAA